MAIVTGTTSTFTVGAAGGNREDLEDTIHDLFADENYMQGNLDSVSATSTKHEWLSDELDAPGFNTTIEGDEAEFTAVTNPTRFVNYTQIVRKTFIISGTQEVVNKAGRASEIGRQAVRKMREAANDFEYTLVRDQQATAGAAASGRALGSIENWIGATAPSHTVATAIVYATTAATATTAVVPSGAATGAVADGTGTGALEEETLNLALEHNWRNGSETSAILVGAGAKNAINGFSGIAQRQIDVNATSQAPIVGAADVYVSNYGVHRVVLHRHVKQTVALCLDMSMLAIGTLRGWMSEPLAKTGDAEKRQILCEKTLVVRNPKAHSKVTNIA